MVFAVLGLAHVDPHAFGDTEIPADLEQDVLQAAGMSEFQCQYGRIRDLIAIRG